MEIPGVGIWGSEDEGEDEDEELPMRSAVKQKKRVGGPGVENGADGVEDENMEVAETQDDFFQGWGEDHLEE